MSKKIEPLIMPKWGIEMDEGKLTEWLIEEGTTFSKGDPLVVIETDKISNEVEAEIDSTFRKKVVEADGTYAVGALLGIFATDDTSDEEIDEFVNSYVAPDTSFKPESGTVEKIIDLLLNEGIKVDNTDLTGQTPLHYAVRTGHLDADNKLCSEGANPNHQAKWQKLSPLHLASVLGCLLYTSPSPRDRQKSRMPSSA